MAHGKNRLAGWIGIPPAGVGLVLRRVAFHAVFIAGVTQIKSASNALYLARREPEGLAVLYIAVAIAVAVLSALLSQGLVYRRPLDLLRKAGIAMGIVMALLFALAVLDISDSYGVTYVFGELYATGLSVLFWADASERFDMRVQKRIVGLLAAGGMLGAIVGGASVRPLAGLLGVEYLLGAASLTLFVALPLLGRDFLERRHRPRLQGTSKERLKTLFGQSYPRYIAVVVASLAVLATVVDYHFRLDAAGRLDEHELAALFGDLNAVVGVAGLAFQTFLTARLLSTLGVFVFLSLIPALVGGLATGVAFSGWFGLTVLLKGAEMAGSYSLYQPGLQLLYNPLPTEQRHALRPIIDGAIKKAGVAAGGLGLIALTAAGADKVALPTVIACALVSLALIRFLRKGYIATLDARLGKQRLRLQYAIDPTDRITRETLTRSLLSNNGREALTAFTILERWPEFEIAPYLKHLLVHANETVRLAAIEKAQTLCDPLVLHSLGAILATDRRRPRARAARALAVIDPNNAATSLRPYLNDPDPGVRVAVVAALLPLEQDGEGPGHVGLGLLLSNPEQPPPVRRELAKLIGELKDPSLAPTLADLLADPEASVRGLACLSAAALKDMELADDIIRMLLDRSVRSAAREALANYGELVVERLSQQLNDRRCRLRLRLEIPWVLRTIGTETAAKALLFSNIMDNATLRYRIAVSLFAMTQANPKLVVDSKRADEAALRRLKAYRYYRPTLRSLQQSPDPVFAPMTRAVLDRVSQNLEMGLRLLGLCRDGEMMQRIFSGIDERGTGLRAEALELIDVALAKDPLRSVVLNYLEEDTLPGSTPQQEVETLLHSKDPILRGLAHWVADKIGSTTTDIDPKAEAAPIIDVEGEEMNRPFVERLLLLENVDLFSKLSMDDLAAIASIASEREAAPGEVIYREGDTGDAMFVIVQGKVELLKGDKRILQLRNGESIGQVSIMDGGLRPVTAKVVQGSMGATLLVIERTAFMELLADRFELVTGLFAVMAQRLRKLIDLSGSK